MKQSPVQQPLQVDHKPHPHRDRKMILNWRDGGKAPFEISRGAAMVDGDVAYFMNWNSEVCSYNLTSKEWSKLPTCPYHYSGLAVINGQLTAILVGVRVCSTRIHTAQPARLQRDLPTHANKESSHNHSDTKGAPHRVLLQSSPIMK